MRPPTPAERLAPGSPGSLFCPHAAQACIAWCQKNGRYVDTEFPPDKCAARTLRGARRC